MPEIDRSAPITSPNETGPGPIDAVSPFRRAIRRFIHNRLAMVAFGYLLLMILVAAFGSWIAPHNPNRQQFVPFLGPNRKNWLGTDDLGRDIASRLIDGTYVSVRAGYQTVTTAIVVAVPLGLIAGYCGGWIDNALMRVMEAVTSFPALVLAIVIAAVLGPGLNNAMLAITIVIIPGFVRLTRASTLAVKEETFIEASRSIGTRTSVILRRRVLPSVASPIIITASLVLGIALIAEAGLSFLGLGAQPPDASWGNMLRRGFTYLYSDPYQMVPPGVAIVLAVLSFNIVGDALRDALAPGGTTTRRGRHRGRMGLTAVEADPGSRVVVTSERGQAQGGVRSNGAMSRDPHPERSQQPAYAATPLLSVRDLVVEFDTDDGLVTVVDGVSFDVMPGEAVGLVGESGSGKTVTSMAIMRLLGSPPARVRKGQVNFAGQDLLQLDFKELNHFRGNSLSMVFQDPMSSLNPAFTVGNQLIEAIRAHQRCSRDVARRRAAELLELVGIPDPASRIQEYPHRLSGGMRQRVLIAMALANQPKLLIADEPTTALDVTVQAQIIQLLKSLQREFDMAMIFVSHDLGVIAEVADKALVMYAGEIVEEAPVTSLFNDPQHPYMRKLLAAMPQAAEIGRRLPSIAGMVPPPGQWPAGCRFAPRCDRAEPSCEEAPVSLRQVAAQRSVRCVRAALIDAERTS